MGPTYDLETIKAKVRIGHYVITNSAVDTAHALELDAADIRECVLLTRSGDFYKTMRSHAMPGTMQDVYRRDYGGKRIYLKLRIDRYHCVVVISFKEWT